jgi:transposase
LFSGFSLFSAVRGEQLPEVARACHAALGVQLRLLKAQILKFDRRIMAWHRSNETSRRLDAIPGVGPALATAQKMFMKVIEDSISKTS